MATRLAANLALRFRKIDQTRVKMESLFAMHSLSRDDIETVYEGLFIRSITTFEESLEELFVKIMLNKVNYSLSQTQHITPRVNFRSQMVLMQVLNGGKSYIDWLPYDRTQERASIFLRGGRPFSDLSRQDRTRLEHALMTRNAIAHSSKHARQRFEQKVISSTPLLPRERTPAGYLRSVWRVNPSTTRFESYLFDLNVAFRHLCL